MLMINHFKTLEFDTILNQLADCAVSEAAQERCRKITPAKDISMAKMFAKKEGYRIDPGQVGTTV